MMRVGLTNRWFDESLLGAAHVILRVRSEARGEAVKQSILESMDGPAAEACSIEVRLIDLASFASFKGFTETVSNELNRIDIALLNAGISKADLSITQDGWEENNQVNALAPTFVATSSAQDARIFVGRPDATSKHRGTPSLSNLNKEQELAGFCGRYAVSKLLVMFAMGEIAQVATALEGRPEHLICKTSEEGSWTLVFGSGYGERSHGQWIQNNHIEDSPANASPQIQCDEQRPSCSQCRRGRRTCPGYERAMVFIDEGVKPGKNSTGRQRPVLRTSKHGSRHFKTPRVKGEHSQVCALDAKHENRSGGKQSSTPPPNEQRAPPRLASPRAEQHQLIASFISAMFPLGVDSLQISLLGTWLWHIPPRLGHNAALDYASLAVAMGYFGRTTRNDAVVAGAESAYAMALQNLSTMLNIKDVQFEPEVLCATMLLGHYESFSGTGHAWIRHAGGGARLMHLRGARRSYESAFEYSMFLACRGTIISQALVSETPCFLEEESWQAIPDGLIEFPLLPSDAHLYHLIFRHYAAIPGLLKQFRDLAAKKSGVQLDTLLVRTGTLCQDLERWYTAYTSFEAGRKTPTLFNKKTDTASEYPFTDAYMYHDTISASNITACYAYQILLQREVDALLPGTYIRENIELAESICKSVEYLSNAGYCGTQTMRLTLPIAQSVLPARYQTWIASKMARISQDPDETTLLSVLQ
ncbi:hypothetical protein PWT90_06529 [Aphanocladium album]|nr:hypothetical protein PWT90_06529 [Aphanocladium album]